MLSIDTSVTTAINSIMNGKQKAHITDAAGRELKHLQHGINIVNGVKVIVK